MTCIGRRGDRKLGNLVEVAWGSHSPAGERCGAGAREGWLRHSGDVRIHVDRTVGLDDVPEALSYVGEGRTLGKVVATTN